MILLAGILLVLLALIGTPLFVVIGGGALLYFYSAGIDISVVIIELYRIAKEPVFLAIPLFTFAGYIMAECNTPRRMINLYNALFGWMPGGFAIVALVSCALFTAFTGASGVTIIALGGLLFPILNQQNYPERFSLGLLTSSGSLGLLFPPSLPMILYAHTGQTSLDQLFLAGVIPGILLIIMLSGFSIWKGSGTNVPRNPFVLKNVYPAFREAVWEIPLPFIIIGGIYGGIFTATEAAAITAFYVLVVEVFIYRELSLVRDIKRIIKESMILVGGILIIVGTALGFTSFLVDAQIPMQIFSFIQTWITNKWVFLILLNIFLLIVGCLMDIFSAILVVVPLIKPIADGFGVDPVHLGIIFLTNLEIGYFTPPVGLNLFIASFRFKKSIFQLYRATIPFLVILLIALLLITYVPDLSLTLVRIFGQ